MIARLIWPILLCLYSICVNAQMASSTIEIKYSFATPNMGMLYYELAIQDSLSQWRIIPKEQITTGNNLSINTTNDYFFFKRKKTKIIIYTEFINKGKYVVIDSLHAMKWKLTDETKDILGLHCHSAKTNFRGREYMAFYTAKIPVADGPWKFGGLPGTILEVQSIDKEFLYQALEINQKPNESPILIPKTTTPSAITWTKFKDEFVIAIDKAVKLMKSTETEDDNGYPSYYKYYRPEIIYPKVQLGGGIRF